jgi:hypothetical protein
VFAHYHDMRNLLVPIGAYSVPEPAGPAEVVITFRAGVVAADPARVLEAAARRARSRDAVARLTAVRQVVRAHRRFVAGFYSHQQRRRER